MMRLQIIYLATDELVPYINNARDHSDEQIKQIVESIKEFGFNNPILIDETGVIIAGHGRLAAAQELELESVPTITLAGLSPAQKRAYAIADNKLALNADWNFDLLRLELAELRDLDFNLDLLAFDRVELDDLIGKKNITQDLPSEADNSIPEKFVVEVYCEDSSHQEHVLNKLRQLGYSCNLSH